MRRSEVSLQVALNSGMNGPWMRPGNTTTGTQDMVSELLTEGKSPVRCSTTPEEGVVAEAVGTRLRVPEQTKRVIGSILKALQLTPGW